MPGATCWMHKSMDERSKISQEIKHKYMIYSDLIKRNRLDLKHNKYCNQTDHSLCGAIWGHASIVQEIIGRIWWWFTGEQPHSVSISRKPKIQSIMDQVFKQREERELEDAEYSWLMQIISRCKQLIEKKETKNAK